MRAALLADIGTDLSFEPAATTAPTATLAGIYLHSRHDPLREARRRIATAGDAQFTLFLGFGLGYFLEAFIDKQTASTQANQAIVIIATAARFLQALTCRDMSHFSPLR